MARSILTVFAVVLLLSVVKADWPGGPGGPGGWGGNGPWNGNGGGNPFGNGDNNNNNNGDGSSTASSTNGFGLGSVEAFNRASKVLIAHAVIASLVWVVFMPTGAILLRLNLKNPIVLKLHAGCQTLSYILFIVAAGMGIFLAQQTSRFGSWEDPHPRLGLAILAIAFFQPIFGAIHHRIFKKRSADLKAGRSTKPPGRTVIGRVHLWVGRALILMGMVNGGLGIRLASFSPFQTDATTRKASIAYGIAAAAMFTLYAALVLIFEIRRKRAQRSAGPQTAHGQQTMKDASGLPTYDESEESLRGGATSRYH